MTFTFVLRTHFKEALQGQLPHRCPQGGPQGPSPACFLIPAQTRLRGSHMLPGAAGHHQLPPNHPGVTEGRPAHPFFCGASIYGPLQSCLLAGFTRRWCFECRPACGDGFPRSFLPCQMPHLGVCERSQRDTSRGPDSANCHVKQHSKSPENTCSNWTVCCRQKEVS